MGQANFNYSQAGDGKAGRAPALSVFADRLRLQAQLRDDAIAAGFRIGDVATVAHLPRNDLPALADVVLVDCPAPDAAALAALTGLDARAAAAGAQLIIATTVAALDAVFCCLDQSGAQILVDPSRGEWVVALGRALASIPRLTVQDLSEEDRLVLLRLTEQVGQIASRLERLEAPLQDGLARAETGVFRFEAPKSPFRQQDDGGNERLVRTARPPLPEARLVRRIIRQRQLRARFFDGDLFADPAWDMLLDLTAARVEHSRVSVTSLCIASGVPPTTALRWIGQLIDAGLMERVEDDTDRRRAFITLTDRAADAMARFFAEIGRQAGRMV